MTFWSDIAPFAVIKKWAGRVQLGKAADNSGGYYPPRGGDFPDDANGAGWAFRDAQVMVHAQEGNMAIVGFSRTSDDPGTNGDGQVSGHAAIAVSGFIVNDKPNGRGWAAYLDVQHEAGAKATSGMEISVKNKGANVVQTPYSVVEGVSAIGVQAGGDPNYGGPSANPAASLITLVKNPNSHPLNAMFVVQDGALTGAYPVWTALPKGAQLIWYAPGNGVGASIRSDVAEPGHKVTMAFVNDGVNFYGDNGQIIFAVKHVANGVNQIMFKNGAAGDPPSLGATGPDANIDLHLKPKGTGKVRFGTRTAAGDAASNGYVIIEDDAGNTVKLMTRA